MDRSSLQPEAWRRGPGAPTMISLSTALTGARAAVKSAAISSEAFRRSLR